MAGLCRGLHLKDAAPGDALPLRQICAHFLLELRGAIYTLRRDLAGLVAGLWRSIPSPSPSSSISSFFPRRPRRPRPPPRPRPPLSSWIRRGAWGRRCVARRGRCGAVDDGQQRPSIRSGQGFRDGSATGAASATLAAKAPCVLRLTQDSTIWALASRGRSSSSRSRCSSRSARSRRASAPSVRRRRHHSSRRWRTRRQRGHRTYYPQPTGASFLAGSRRRWCRGSAARSPTSA